MPKEFIIEDGILTEYNGNDEDVVIPEGIIALDDRVFEGRDIKSVKFPSSLKTVGVLAFFCCKKLSRIEFNEGLEELLMLCFSNCESLKEISLPSTLKMLDSYESKFDIFEDCKSLCSITIDKKNPYFSSMDSNVIYDIKTKTVLFGCKSSKIPQDTKAIGPGAYYNSDISSLSLPDGLERICSEAFCGCNKLSDVFIPSTVSEIEDYVFLNCNLDTITVAPENDTYYARDNALIRKSDNVLILGTKNSLICADVKEIGDLAFCGTDIKALSVPSSVKFINNSAFANSGLEEIVLSEGLLMIGDMAFRNCKKLKKVTLPHSLMKNMEFYMDFGMGPSVFDFCDNLETLTFCGTESEWQDLCTACKFSFDGNVIFKK